eukprot:NODE_1817_length_1394_cov_33.457993_g1644_i0.p1 GENE.NODE_1817_length_1394_cov_33.457993_g1644_i0~~NODE_1817_length_1394_cov_33.457993_g1644_i0.p1  ORF type:complete len:390 (+),score=52.67 NODE_1817_length_1394_cov_33.457993_g1644_i0:168-1337(+)
MPAATTVKLSARRATMVGVFTATAAAAGLLLVALRRWRSHCNRLNLTALPATHRVVALGVGGTQTKMIFTGAFCEDLALPFPHSLRNLGAIGALGCGSDGSGRSAGLRCITFLTSSVDLFCQTVGKYECVRTLSAVHVTGGGAVKYAELASSALAIQVVGLCEMKCLVGGLNYLWSCRPDLFYFLDTSLVTCAVAEPTFPYLVVNVGSGVSIIKVNGWQDFERVSGSAVGGATFMGLIRLLANVDSMEQGLEMAAHGDSCAVDLTVADIYGAGATLMLPPDLLAASLGKIGIAKRADSEDFRRSDVIASVLLMLCCSLTQLATLNADLHGVKGNVIFTGGFVQGQSTVVGSLAKALAFWTAGQKNPLKALFLAEDIPLGALGAMLLEAE